MNKNKIWNCIRYSSQFIDNNIEFILNKFINKIVIVDKLQLILFVTWLWVYIGLIVTKILEKMLKVLLKLPDTLLNIPLSKVESTNGDNINIISAVSNDGEVTNKLKLLLRLYWQKGGDEQVSEENGIDCQKIFDLLKCSVIYICYFLEEKNKQPANTTNTDNTDNPNNTDNTDNTANTNKPNNTTNTNNTDNSNNINNTTNTANPANTNNTNNTNNTDNTNNTANTANTNNTYNTKYKGRSLYVEKKNEQYYRFSTFNKGDYKKILMRHLSLD
jgi:hypothetical protein